MSSDTSERSIIAGFAAALAAAATGLSLYAFDGMWLPPLAFLGILVFGAFPLALAHAVLVAMPLYFHWIERWPLGWWNAGLAGVAVGAGPLGVLAVITGDLGVVNEIALWGGACGLVGGLVFRLVRGPDRRQRDAPGSAQ